MYKKCVSNVASIMVNISARGQPFLYTAAVLFSGSYNRGSLCFSRSSCCIIPSSNNERNFSAFLLAYFGILCAAAAKGEEEMSQLPIIQISRRMK
ncbi:hypothetical protein RB195_001603 [Necator americanus]|uniref:Uncharacterized protein n=1 Tax=Necator americanus TaxID=51031 RepID=A0ABR1DFH2_NECAM